MSPDASALAILELLVVAEVTSDSGASFCS